MNPIDWLFKLLLRFVPMDETEFGKMRSDAFAWYSNIDVTNETENQVAVKFKKIFLDWRGKLALAVLFIPASRWLANLMNPTIDEDDDE